MQDRNDAPLGATDEPSPKFASYTAPPTPTLPWPPAHEWPADDAPTLAWARFYRDRLGLLDLRPTPSQVDRDEHAVHIRSEAESHWLWEHKGAEIPLEVAALIRQDAAAEANNVRGPIPKIAAAFARISRPVTDDDFVRWFEPLGHGQKAQHTAHHRERGIACLLGARCAPIAAWNTQIDVDPRRGGALEGGLVDTPGPRVHTPGGGVHVFLRAAPGHVVHPSAEVLAPGLEVRCAGWALLPSGLATPGRWWTGREQSVAPPEALLRPAPRPPRVAGLSDMSYATGPNGQVLGRVATLIASPIGRGDGRTGALGSIVGMLAQTHGLPGDFVDACTALLVEYGTGRDWNADRIREECIRWRLALTRGPRDAEFAAEVAEVWITTRNLDATSKGASWARRQAWSIWKTADRREEGQAGAEDAGLIGGVDTLARPFQGLPPVSAAAPPQAPSPTPVPPAPAPMSAEVRASDYVLHGPLCQCGQCKVAAPEVADAKVVAHERMLRALLPTIARAYPRESLHRDFLKVPAKVETLYPFADFVSMALEPGEMGAPPVGHGYGQWFGRAYGGITEGDFQAFGAAGAKGGKTFFVGQMADGLAMGTAARILGVKGYEAAPLVMPVWVSEMPKEGEVWLRMISRHFGFDLSAASKGTMSAEMPGVLHMAQALDRSPAWIVAHARAIAEIHSDPRFEDMSFTLGARATGLDVVPAWAAHNVVREIDLSVLPNPEGQGRSRVDHRSGPTMIGYLADAVALLRRDLATLAGVAEDQVLPLVILDPGQRFAGEGSSSKDALDSLLGAVTSRICRRKTGLGAACIMSSDTTKAAARDLDLETFRSASGQRLAADIFAGSQGIMHHCDVYAICGQETGSPYRQTQWVRVLQSRTGAPAECFPFLWETHLGRFRPRPAEPLSPPPAYGGGPGKGHGHGRTSDRGAAPAGGVGPRPPGPYRNGAVRLGED